MRQVHTYSGSNNNHLLERTYIGEGKYFQRGICKGISVGDDFHCFTENQRMLTVEEIKLKRNAKGVFNNESDAIDAYYEAVLHDKSYSNIGYLTLRKI